MLIDICRMIGPEAIAQVDLGTREHRNRSLQSLRVQAAEVMATMLSIAPGLALPAAILTSWRCVAPTDRRYR